jgi:hypothetical protein
VIDHETLEAIKVMISGLESQIADLRQSAVTKIEFDGLEKRLENRLGKSFPETPEIPRQRHYATEYHSVDKPVRRRLGIYG